jgi:acetyl esterase/lipase
VHRGDDSPAEQHPEHETLDGAKQRDDERLLASAPADVRERLAEIGEFTLGQQNMAQMRSQPLRDPGTPSGAVEHADHIAPGGPGDPDVPVRLHRERGITEPRPCLPSVRGGGYVIGSNLGDDGRFDRWSPKRRCVGVSVGYRLASRDTVSRSAGGLLRRAALGLP